MSGVETFCMTDTDGIVTDVEPSVRQQLVATMCTLQEEGMKVTGAPLVYQYHPPFAPPFLRRVEVLYAVA